MRMSQLFGRRLREAPGGAGLGTGLAMRAGLVRAVGEGLAWLPTGERVLRRLEASLAAGLLASQRLALPPGEAEAGVAGLIGGEVQSYRQLPAHLSAQRWIPKGGGTPDVARPEPALLWVAAVGEEAGLVAEEARWAGGLQGWWERHGLEVTRCETAGSGWRWLHPHAEGGHQALRCGACGYAADASAARFRRVPTPSGLAVPMGEVATPGADTIHGLAEMLGVPESQTLKAVFLADEAGELVFAVLRGDLEIALPKLAGAVGSASFNQAPEALIRAAGAEPGFASPVGLKVRGEAGGPGVRVVADLSVEAGTNFVAGANRAGYHLTGVNYPRDFKASLVADIAAARPGFPCPNCGGALQAAQGIDLGNWRRLAEGFAYADASGREQRGAVGLGVLLLEAILTALIARLGTDKAMAWPPDLAPFDAHVIDLKAPEPAAAVEAELERAGLSVLLDDRPVSAGVKFSDADLIGCPVRVVVSPRSLEQGGAEITGRGVAGPATVPLDEVVEAVRARIS